jgi:hypothetical protein
MPQKHPNGKHVLVTGKTFACGAGLHWDKPCGGKVNRIEQLVIWEGELTGRTAVADSAPN